MTPLQPTEEKVPLWRDERFWQVALQVLTLLVLVGLVGVAIANLNFNLARQGRQFEFGFLQQRSGFNIGEFVIPYNNDAPYWWAYWVGLVNTLRLAAAALVLATILGLAGGLATFSDNWLLRKIALGYVEVARNIPPLLQFFFWYFVVLFGLSDANKMTRLFGGLLLISKKGVWLPWPTQGIVALLLLALGIAAFVLWQWRLKLMEAQGLPGQWQLLALRAIAALSLLLLIFGLGWQAPQVISEAGDANGGLRLSLEFAAMMCGLGFYCGAFITEIVRGGIQSVAKGQWEAARSLGLPTGHTMRLVVLPQALRVIIPSLNSQYATLIKNSSLSVVIGYPDVFSVGLTTINQAGRAIEMVLLLSGTYLLMNASVSIVMNTLNRVVQLKER